MSTSRKVRGFAAVALAGLLVAACGSSSKKTAGSAGATATTAGAPKSMIKIGVMLPTTGPFASGGDYLKVINTIPKQPGRATIDGHPYEFIIKDDAGTATQASGIVRSFIDSDKINVMFGSNVTAVQAAILPLVTDAKLLEFTFSGCPDCGDGTKNPYTFSLEFDRPTQGPATVNRIKALKKSTVGILESQDPTSKDYSNALQSAATASGGAVTVNKIVPFQPATLDLSSQVSQMKAANPDVVYIASFAGADLANAVKAMDEIGWHPILMGNSALGGTVVTDAVPASQKAWIKTWAASGFGLHQLNGALSPEATTWRQNLKNIAGSDINGVQLNAVATGQDAFDIYKAAVEATHSLDGPTLAKWIETNGYPKGIRAAYTFTPTRHNGFTATDVGWAIPGTQNDGFLDAAPLA